MELCQNLSPVVSDALAMLAFFFLLNIIVVVVKTNATLLDWTIDWWLKENKDWTWFYGHRFPYFIIIPKNILKNDEKVALNWFQLFAGNIFEFMECEICSCLFPVETHTWYRNKMEFYASNKRYVVNLTRKSAKKRNRPKGNKINATHVNVMKSRKMSSA